MQRISSSMPSFTDLPVTRRSTRLLFETRIALSRPDNTIMTAALSILPTQ
jgi:hypothetical protein